jgi:iron complex outermembrane receptor protein
MSSATIVAGPESCASGAKVSLDLSPSAETSDRVPMSTLLAQPLLGLLTLLRNAAVTNSLLRGGSALMRLGVLATAVSLCLIGLCSAQNSHAAIRKDLNIPSEPLSPALQTVATAYELQVLYPTRVAEDLKTHGAAGSLTSDEALTQVLSGTGLSYKYLDANTVTVFAQPSKPPTLGIALRDGDEPQKEGKKDSSGGFRVAQVDQTSTGNQTVEQKEQEKKAEYLQEVIVVGSRIPVTAKEGPQDVKIYSAEQIERSGQSTVADFLSTLPQVSIASNEANTRTFGSATSVQLHGLPIGTTLVLINGHRVESSGAQGPNSDFFDLNNIPLSAVERVEVLSEGSSAIYGSDAIAGVVNIVLKANFDGLESSVRYGFASGPHEWDGSVAWGTHSDKFSLSVIGSVLSRTELQGFDRSLTASNDYTAYGGTDTRSFDCNPGNVYSIDGSNLPGVGAPSAGVPPGFHGPPSLQEFSGTGNALNLCSLNAYGSYIAQTRRQGVFVQASYNLAPAVRIFTELLASHTEEINQAAPAVLDGAPGAGGTQFTAAAGNPYNPFGEDVGVSGLLSSLGRQTTPLDTVFFRALVGAAGDFAGDSWHWEITAWDAHDKSDYKVTNTVNNTAMQNALNSTDPSTALNPFVDKPYASSQLLQSLVYEQRSSYIGETRAANAFIRGSPFSLPSGDVKVVLGSEFDRDYLEGDEISLAFAPPNTRVGYYRTNYSLFGEGRIPILANYSRPEGRETLVATVAGRFDHFSDFGHATTPQYGLEWRPLSTLLFRGSYSQAFKAPTLYNLYSQVYTYQVTVVDPLRGNQVEVVRGTFGGNLELQPETGLSRTLGFTYASEAIRDLEVGVTWWSIDETNSIQAAGFQEIVSNSNDFPGAVIRGPSQGGLPGLITSVAAGFVNFGAIRAAGFDYTARYKHQTPVGVLSGSLSATQTERFTTALRPGTPPVDVDSKAQDGTGGIWSPRWKGTAAFGWQLGAYNLNVDGRYVGPYRDYDSTNREIGNFWLFDANLRYSLSHVFGGSRLKNAYIEFGGVNVLNRLPQYSNYNFGTVGYDPAEADIRGRFLYVQIGTKL